MGFLRILVFLVFLSGTAYAITPSFIGTVSRSTAAPVNSVAPVISSTYTEAYSTITVDSTGTWSGSPSFTCQWERDGVDISGETSCSEYVTGAADAGTDINVTVTGTNAGGSTDADSNAISIIAVDRDIENWMEAAFIIDNILTYSSADTDDLYNLEQTPRSGVTQTTYQITGLDASSSSFQGTEGVDGAYIQCGTNNAADIRFNSTSNTTAFNEYHKNGSNRAFAWALRGRTATASAVNIMGTQDDSGQAGQSINHAFFAGGNTPGYQHFTGVGGEEFQPDVGTYVADNTEFELVITYDPVTDTLRANNDGNLYSSSGRYTTATDASAVFGICGYSDAATPGAFEGRISEVVMLDDIFLSSAELASFWARADDFDWSTVEFTAVTDQIVLTSVSSNIQDVSFLSASSAFTVTNGVVDICDDAACSTVNHDDATSGTVDPDEYVRLAQTTSSSYETEIVTTLSLPQADYAWSVTTGSAPPVDPIVCLKIEIDCTSSGNDCRMSDLAVWNDSQLDMIQDFTYEAAAVTSCDDDDLQDGEFGFSDVSDVDRNDMDNNLWNYAGSSQNEGLYDMAMGSKATIYFKSAAATTFYGVGTRWENANFAARMPTDGINFFSGDSTPVTPVSGPPSIGDDVGQCDKVGTDAAPLDDFECNFGFQE